MASTSQATYANPTKADHSEHDAYLKNKSKGSKTGDWTEFVVGGSNEVFILYFSLILNSPVHSLEDKEFLPIYLCSYWRCTR